MRIPLSRRIIVWVTVSLVAVTVLVVFAYGHYGQTVDLDFGLFRLEDVRLPFALYGAIIVGMLIMLAVGIRSDLRTRELLRQRPESSSGSTTPERDEPEGSLQEADRGV